MHITGGGWSNLLRTLTPVTYMIEELPPLPHVFKRIQDIGNVSDEEMFSVYNMGIGLGVVVAERDLKKALTHLQCDGKKTYYLGYVKQDVNRNIFIKEKGYLL
jgi:phosphoribosylformylglycinamidine cyclo-ligase